MAETGWSVGGLLRRAQRHLRASAVFLGLHWWVAVCCGLWFGLFALDNLLNLPAGLRLPLAVGAAALTVGGLLRRVLLPAADRPGLEHVAVVLERRYGIADNLLINACQFERQPLQPAERMFAERTLTLCRDAVSRVRFRELWQWGRLVRWGAAAAVVVGLWTAYIAWFPHYVLNAGARYVAPLADVPPVSALQLELEPSSDVVLTEGDSLLVRVKLTRRGEPLQVGHEQPVIVRKEAAASVEPVRTAGEQVPMTAEPDAPRCYTHQFGAVRRSFAFRVFAADTYSKSVHVQVQPLPRIRESTFVITPPAYTGLPVSTTPGPPASVSVLPGSRLAVQMRIEPAVNAAVWKDAGQSSALQKAGFGWSTELMVTQAGPYEIEVTRGDSLKSLAIARGEIVLQSDNPPEVEFLSDDRNRLVNPGAELPLALEAKDDFGVKWVAITVRAPDAPQAQKQLKQWVYLGPPGNRGPLREKWVVQMEPQQFLPGATYLLEAQAVDFQPGRVPVRSRPIAVRVKSAAELTLAGDDAFAVAFDLLRQTAVRQEQANNLTANLQANLEEVIQRRSIAAHQQSLTDRQTAARDAGRRAVVEFRKLKDGAPYAAKLGPLVDGEMAWVLGDIGKLAGTRANDLPSAVEAIDRRQQYILSELLALLGRLADQRQEAARAEKKLKELQTPPAVTAKEELRELKDELKRFVREQERVIERSRTLADKQPQDLTQQEEKVLGELARVEAGWATYFEEALTDFSKLPLQDFADASLARELNEVFQEIRLAAKSLYEKKVQIAVPHEQAGLENAQELVHNLERWLPDTPDHEKWSMEEPPAPADIALAELPAELEDIVGELLDKEEELGDDVEDVTSSWLDSIDKGAGWDAMDGPISSMSAKGVTGNRLPNRMEVGGRAGEGRTGQSHGQMVEDAAEGKQGRETPTRLTPSPFEPGSVNDQSTADQGGATGGGKLAGFAAEGLRGPAAPPVNQDLPRLADQQAKIRQQAEVLALKLRRYKLPTGDLETSITAMQEFESAARRGDGLAVRQSYSRVLDALGDAKQAVRAETSLHRERVALPEWLRKELLSGLQDAIPRGYEEMVSEYFRALAGMGVR